jgi:hypothetical protein
VTDIGNESISDVLSAEITFNFRSPEANGGVSRLTFYAAPPWHHPFGSGGPVAPTSSSVRGTSYGAGERIHGSVAQMLENGRARVQSRAMLVGNGGDHGNDGLLESVSYRIH